MDRRREMDYTNDLRDRTRDRSRDYETRDDFSNMYYPYMPYDSRRGLYYDPSSPIQMPITEDMDSSDEMDIEYMKRMYPELARQLQYYVDEECDKMEYDGSYMYDEYPDKESLYMMVEKIYERIMSDPSVRINEVFSDSEKDKNEKNVESQQFGFGARGLRDLIQVMLLNEIFRRRRRYSRRRRPRRYTPTPRPTRPYRQRRYYDYY
ncbi:hypothetical protein EDC19_2738 [Natranaerovirga hydrolytica]|uniref:Uncharacterized protein n=1 Tax=Natranaerovirga hydrolytica TaxID=680378 RepID=A0A4R1MAC0_9FIRM|nr:hypothetical protein [Natranaerovirga hydrolytica]TCK87894.1 hypothetical protein EDC19_2738 [Natranaerovirga hydrolytica]